MFVNFKEREKQITIVLIVTLLLNIVSAGVKLWAGETYHFFALVTSGVESMFDGSSNVLALISIFIASKPADEKHTYGHYKYETLASLLIAILLLFSSYEMGKEVFAKFSAVPKHFDEFPLVPLISLGISMSVSMFVSWYETRRGKELDSPILLADAHHTYGDFLVSFAVGASILLTYYGLEWMDIAVGALICLYLVFLALKILKLNIDELVDATDIIEKKEIFQKVKDLEHVYEIHEIRARGSSRLLYIDFHLLLKDDLPLNVAHDLGHKAEDMIREDLKDFAKDIDITVHIEPYREHDGDHK